MGTSADPAAQGPDLGPVHEEKLSRMRRSIARHMVSSLQISAQTTTVVEVDMTRIEVARRGSAGTALAYLARAAVLTLGEFPQLNSTLRDDVLSKYEAVHLGIAVSLGEDGLIVPVMHHAQDLGVRELAERILDVAARARASQLAPSEVYGGTFTISNTGVFGSVLNTPIINQPQVAILSTEAVIRRPVVVGSGQHETIEVRPVANLCLTWDHRAVDGALAARFLSALRCRLEEWPAPDAGPR